jgi:carboxylesterase type B
MIIGDQEDEGTLFALFQSNLTTNDRLVNYLKSYFFDSATTAQLNDLVNAYGNGLTAVIDGSPFNTGLLNEIFIGFKRRAAIMGDLVFTLARRVFLATANSVNPNVPSWSYLASYDQGTPILGTLHGSDLIQVFFGIKDNYAAKGIRAYYINFVYSLDPNEGRGSYPEWPRWSETNKLLHFFANKFEQLDDNFRSAGYNWLVKNINSLRY